MAKRRRGPEIRCISELLPTSLSLDEIRAHLPHNSARRPAGHRTPCASSSTWSWGLAPYRALYVAIAASAMASAFRESVPGYLSWRSA